MQGEGSFSSWAAGSHNGRSLTSSDDSTLTNNSFRHSPTTLSGESNHSGRRFRRSSTTTTENSTLKVSHYRRSSTLICELKKGDEKLLSAQHSTPSHSLRHSSSSTVAQGVVQFGKQPAWSMAPLLVNPTPLYSGSLPTTASSGVMLGCLNSSRTLNDTAHSTQGSFSTQSGIIKKQESTVAVGREDKTRSLFPSIKKPNQAGKGFMAKLIK